MIYISYTDADCNCIKKVYGVVLVAGETRPGNNKCAKDMGEKYFSLRKAGPPKETQPRTAFIFFV